MSINRANQNWPDGEAHEINVEEKIEFQPYAHTCHIPKGAGHDPQDCPACKWAAERPAFFVA